MLDNQIAIRYAHYINILSLIQHHVDLQIAITEEFILKGGFSIMEIFELWFHKFVASSLSTFQFEPMEGQKDKTSHPRTQKDANMITH